MKKDLIKKLNILLSLKIILLVLYNNIFMFHLANKYKNITKHYPPSIVLEEKNKKNNKEGIYIMPTNLFDKKLKSKKDEQSVYRVLYFISLAGVVYLIFRTPKVLDYFGTARFANSKEIEDMNVLDDSDGVVLGMTKNNKLICHNGPEHISAMAPTRSGKGVGCVLPTLWTWLSSVIVNDIKGECWDLTSGFRRSVLGHKCIFFNPMDETGEGISYDPLKLVKVGTPSEQEDARLVALTLIDVDGKGESDHWISSAVNMLTAVILHVKYANPEATFIDVMEFIEDPKESLVDKFSRIIAKEYKDEKLIDRKDGTKPFNHTMSIRRLIKEAKDFVELYGVDSTLHPIVGATFSTLLTTPDKERGSIISSCTNKLGIFKDPRIRRNISKSDITPKEIMAEKVSLYLITPPKAIKMTAPLFRLFITQTIFELTDKMEFGNRKILDFEKKDKNKTKKIDKKNSRILFLIDEFPALGNLSLLESAMAYIAGYGLKVLLISQAISQLNKIYTKDNSIISNCHCQLYYTPNDEATPKMISEMLGTKTIEIKNTSYTKGVPTYSKSYQSRALMTPGEVRTLPYEDSLVLITGKAPIHGKKLFWFKHKKFKNNANYNIPYKTYLEALDKIEKMGISEYALEYLIYLKSSWKNIKIIINSIGGIDNFLKELVILPEEIKEKIKQYDKLDEKEEFKKEIIAKFIKKEEAIKEYLKDMEDKDVYRYIVETNFSKKELEKMLEKNLKNLEKKLSLSETLKSDLISILKNLRTTNGESIYSEVVFENISEKLIENLLKTINDNFLYEDLLEYIKNELHTKEFEEFSNSILSKDKMCEKEEKAEDKKVDEIEEKEKEIESVENKKVEENKNEEQEELKNINRKDNEEIEDEIYMKKILENYLLNLKDLNGNFKYRKEEIPEKLYFYFLETVKSEGFEKAFENFKNSEKNSTLLKILEELEEWEKLRMLEELEEEF